MNELGGYKFDYIFFKTHVIFLKQTKKTPVTNGFFGEKITKIRYKLVNGT